MEYAILQNNRFCGMRPVSCLAYMLFTCWQLSLNDIITATTKTAYHSLR